jgi:hypothetical protein
VPKSPIDDDDYSLREDASAFISGNSLERAHFHEGLGNFVASWDAAEAAIKEAELFRGKVVFASVKELRYAGRRFTDALKLMLQQCGPEQADEALQLIREASENCIRARNDAVDALVSYLYRYFNQVKNDYGTVLMHAYFPDFMQLFVRLNELAHVIPASRSNERGRRNEIYDGIVKEDIPQLRLLYEKIETSKNLIDEDTGRERDAQRRKDRINQGIGVLGLLLTAIGIALTVLAL